MGDSKKIISDFEHEVSKAHGEGWDFVDLSTEDAKEILELLKEQEPIRPDYDPATLTWSCGNCGQTFDRCKYKFCLKCGRAVQWDKREENKNEI